LPLARTVLDQYLVQRGQLVSRECWNPASPLIASLAEDGTGFVSTRLWRVMRRFLVLATEAI